MYVLYQEATDPMENIPRHPKKKWVSVIFLMRRNSEIEDRTTVSEAVADEVRIMHPLVSLEETRSTARPIKVGSNKLVKEETHNAPIALMKED